MHKALITKSRNREIYLEYDKDSYEIQYVERKNLIILKRLSDNTVVEVFSDDVGFIVQNNSLSNVSFLVSDYSKKDKNGIEKTMLKHYIDRKYSDALLLVNEYELPSDSIYVSRVTDNSYIIETECYSGRIYNLKEKSKRFSHIYNDEKVSKIIGEETLLVQEKLNSNWNSQVEDTITYGINPETFEIVTPIYSELQQRYIDVYTDEQVNELSKKLIQKGEYINRDSFNLGEITIYFEVQRYINEIAQHLQKPKDVYIDDYRVNESFVKTFIKK